MPGHFARRLGVAAAMALGVFVVAFGVFVLSGTGTSPAFAQTASSTRSSDATASAEAAQDKDGQRKLDEARAAIKTLSELLAARLTIKAEISVLAEEQKNKATEEPRKKEIAEKLEELTLRLKEIEDKIENLTTGAASGEFESTRQEKFDLNSEVQGLLKPFIAMLRTATEDARQIETLRTGIRTAERRLGVAKRAIERLKRLRTIVADTGREGALAQGLIGQQSEDWERRLSDVRTELDAAKQQLTLKLRNQQESQDGVGSFVGEFVRTRGFNLFLGLLAFGVVFGVLGLIKRLVGRVQKARGIPRSFVTRLISLVFQIVTMLASVFAMLTVFNTLNDWLLMGLTAVMIAALAWLGLKMLPSLIEQMTLLLNLGAVQEGERVTINGVPWRVEQLDYYTDLVNPALDGGHFTVPVRELSGHHSRPPAKNEAWFPTDTGDWLQLSDGRIAQVMTQTPELVQLKELGGARVTFPTADFLSALSRNLSHGFRVEIEVGIDYKHQSIATDTLPEALSAYIRDGLVRLIGAEPIKCVEVELVRAGASSIDYEIEADIKGEVASEYETIEREMARLAVAACNDYQWALALPQMVLHNSQVTVGERGGVAVGGAKARPALVNGTAKPIHSPPLDVPPTGPVRPRNSPGIAARIRDVSLAAPGASSVLANGRNGANGSIGSPLKAAPVPGDPASVAPLVTARAVNSVPGASVYQNAAPVGAMPQNAMPVDSEPRNSEPRNSELRNSEPRNSEPGTSGPRTSGPGISALVKPVTGNPATGQSPAQGVVPISGPRLDQ